MGFVPRGPGRKATVLVIVRLEDLNPNRARIRRPWFLAEEVFAENLPVHDRARVQVAVNMK